MWPQLEPLLAKVAKPARYIGCEDGAQRPDHSPGPSGLAPGVPRHLRDRPAQPGPADPLRDPQRTRRCGGRAHLRPLGRPRGSCCAPAACRCSRSTPTGRPATSTCSPSTSRPSSSYTNLLNWSTSPACPVRAADRRPEHPLVGRRRALHVQPRAHRRLRRLRRARRRRGGRRRDHRGRSAPGRRPVAPRQPRARPAGARRRSRASTCRRCTTCDYDGRRPRGVTPRYPDVPEQVEKRTVADLADWPYPKQPARAAHRGRARPAQRRGLPGLHARLPLLPGGHDHPPGPRAPGRAGAHDGRRRPAAHRLRRGRPHVAVHRRLLGHRAASSATS